MRTRKSIWDEREYKGRADESLVLETLLDIRELLSEPVDLMKKHLDKAILPDIFTPVSEKGGKLKVESYSTSEPIPIMEPPMNWEEKKDPFAQQKQPDPNAAYQKRKELD